MLAHAGLEVVGLAHVLLATLEVERVHHGLVGVTVVRRRGCGVVLPLAHVCCCCRRSLAGLLVAVDSVD